MNQSDDFELYKSLSSETELNDIEFFEKYNNIDTNDSEEYNVSDMRDSFARTTPGIATGEVIEGTSYYDVLIQNGEIPLDYNNAFTYPEEMISSSGKLVNVLFTKEERKLFEDEKIHEIDDYNSSISNIPVKRNLGVKMPTFFASEDVSPLEGEVFRIITSIPIAQGYTGSGDIFPNTCLFDATYIYRYMTMNKSNGKGKVSKSNIINPTILYAIEHAIERLRNTYIYADYMDSYGNMCQISENMIVLRRITTSINGVIKSVYQLVKAPALLNYSLATNNIDIRNTNQIHVCTKYSKKLIELQSYLYSIIMDFKKKNQKQGTIYYKSIFSNCNIIHIDSSGKKNRTALKRDKDLVVNTFLNNWVKTGFIKSFEEVDSKNEVRNSIIIEL